MSSRNEKIRELSKIRDTRDQSYLPVLQQELFFEEDPTVSRELRQTIVYLQFVDNPYSIEEFISEELKDLGSTTLQRSRLLKVWSRSVLLLLLLTLIVGVACAFALKIMELGILNGSLNYLAVQRFIDGVFHSL